MLDACARLESSTASGGGPLLLIGLFADDPYPSIARLSAEFAEKHGRPPDREELVRAYYGVRVPDLSLYVGFEQPQMFDVPSSRTASKTSTRPSTPPRTSPSGSCARSSTTTS